MPVVSVFPPGARGSVLGTSGGPRLAPGRAACRARCAYVRGQRDPRAVPAAAQKETLDAAVAWTNAVQLAPSAALDAGRWVKLICGASFEDQAAIRNISLAYALAGVNCIDCAADLAVVSAVVEACDVAQSIGLQQRPWIMISVNDAEDPHFRKVCRYILWWRAPRYARRN